MWKYIHTVLEHRRSSVTIDFLFYISALVFRSVQLLSHVRPFVTPWHFLGVVVRTSLKNVCPLYRDCRSVESLSRVWLFVTPWTAARQASLSITNSRSLLKLMPIESVMPSNHLIFCCPLLLLHSIFPSIRVFSNESVLCIRWPKYWSFSFSISPSKEYSGLISLRIDWSDALAVQGTLKSLLQQHSLKASVL